MSRDKQIEEMAEVLKGMDRLDEARFGFYESYARALYTAGYRKASGVAREAIKEVERILTAKIINIEEDFFHGTAAHWDKTKRDCYEELLVELAELKKKYTEEGK